MCSLAVASQAQFIDTIYNNATPAGLFGVGLNTDTRPAGGFYSLVQSPNITLGYFVDAANGCADNFPVTGTGMVVRDISVFAYAIDATPSLMNGGTMQIRTGGPTGAVVANGTFASSVFTSTYRGLPPTPDDTRRVQRIGFDFPNVFLTPGTYWITFRLNNPEAVNLAAPTLTKVGAGTTPGANGQRFVSGSWGAATDNGGPQDFPFWIQGANCFGTLYAYNNTGKQLLSVNPYTATTNLEETFTAATPNFLGAMTYDSNREAFFFSSTSTHELFIKTNPGDPILVGNYGLGTPFMHGLAYHEQLSTMVGAAFSTGNVYRVSGLNGSTSLIGNTGVPSGFKNLAHVPETNTLYMTDTGTDSLYRVNTTTGVATLIGALGGPTNPQALAWAPDIDIMFLAEASGQLWRVNLATGACTFIGNMGAGSFLSLAYKNDEVFSPISFSITEGTPFGGNLASLQDSDDDKLYILNDENEPNGSVTIFSEYCSPDFRRVYLTLESAATRNDLTEFVDLYNYQSNTYQNIGFSTPFLGDSTIRFQSNGNQWASGNNFMTARIRYIPQADLEVADGWTAAIDWVKMRIVY